MISEILFSKAGVSVNSKQLAQLQALFPNCFDKNGKFLLEKFQTEIAEQTDISREFYEMNWLGKSYAKLLRNLPPKTLLCEDKAHNTKPENANSQNLLIQGDNLEVLKHLKNAYKGRVKMIYIDPPYNTGSDGFVYKDDRKFTPEQLSELAHINLDEAERILKFTAKGANSHSAWLTFMYPRLYIARDLLKEDGVIFISIDDNEVAQLKLLCDEVFGEGNFVAEIIVDGTPKNDPYIVSTSHEYILVYTKDKDKAEQADFGFSNPIYSEIMDIFDKNGKDYKKTEDDLKKFYKVNKLSQDNLANYKFVDEFGVYRTSPLDDPQNSGMKDLRVNPRTGNYCKVPSRGWSCTLETWNEWVSHNLIEFPDNDDLLPNKKTYITRDRKDILRSYIKMQTRKATNDLKTLFGTSITPFANPKPVALLKDLILNANAKNELYLDFFAGSGSFAEAIFEANITDNGNRKFILIQLNEKIEIKGTGKAKKIAKAAYDFINHHLKENNPTIFHLTKERIIRNRVQIVLNYPDLDLGFKVYQTTDNFRHHSDDEFSLEQATLPFVENLTEAQYHSLLTTWALNDGALLTDPISEVKLGDYTAHLCDKRLYLLETSFTSADLLAFIEKLDSDKDFNPNRVIVFGENMSSAMQQELNQAIETYSNKKNIVLSLIIRN
ncbi:MULTISPECIES: site-specific DNA-methyltransferase [unclassified Pasteurella]|uniref:site-specific DNA-methyltransferase n=1 Tax=unclassified Pasteurella TaxID=2621516 RepID=UPI001074028D|nr:site-specific DNA-methyltransferase [Pasteurella sp. 19428wF3_WM03]TFU52443.1 site-specific DNA-methyltransferase [Pasteurella sp. WM03]